MRFELETIKGPALSLKGIDNIHCCNSLPSGMFSICDRITNDVLKEVTKDATNLFVDITTDTFDTTTTS